MALRMEYEPAIEIYVAESGHIVIKAEEMGETEFIRIAPHRVPKIIQGLQDCLEEVEADELVENEP